MAFAGTAQGMKVHKRALSDTDTTNRGSAGAPTEAMLSLRVCVRNRHLHRPASDIH